MRRKVLPLLSCPNCQHDLALSEQKVENDAIIDGSLKCGHCGRSFAVVNGVPRMIVDLEDRKDLSDSWGFEWSKVADGRLETNTYYGQTEEEEVNHFFNYMGISPEELCGKTVLDAGCGCGRLTRALGRYADQVYGIDIASSIDRIHDYCRPTGNVHIIQADILNIPFKELSFDFVFSKLAICYVHQPEQAFRKLSMVVKPSGRLFISVPDKENLAFLIKLKDFLRVTHRIPGELLLVISWGLAPFLSLIKKIARKPLTSVRSSAFLLFNALHPSFMTRHTREEVESWFKRQDFQEITAIRNGALHSVHMRGTKKYL